MTFQPSFAIGFFLVSIFLEQASSEYIGYIREFPDTYTPLEWEYKEDTVNGTNNAVIESSLFYLTNQEQAWFTFTVPKPPAAGTAQIITCAQREVGSNTSSIPGHASIRIYREDLLSRSLCYSHDYQNDYGTDNFFGFCRVPVTNDTAVKLWMVVTEWANYLESPTDVFNRRVHCSLHQGEVLQGSVASVSRPSYSTNQTAVYVYQPVGSEILSRSTVVCSATSTIGDKSNEETEEEQQWNIQIANPITGALESKPATVARLLPPIGFSHVPLLVYVHMGNSTLQQQLGLVCKEEVPRHATLLPGIPTEPFDLKRQEMYSFTYNITTVPNHVVARTSTVNQETRTWYSCTIWTAPPDPDSDFDLPVTLEVPQNNDRIHTCVRYILGGEGHKLSFHVRSPTASNGNGSGAEVFFHINVLSVNDQMAVNNTFVCGPEVDKDTETATTTSIAKMLDAHRGWQPNQTKPSTVDFRLWA